MRFALPRVNASAFARGLAVRQTKRRLEDYLAGNGIGPAELQKMIAKGIGFSQIIPPQDLAEMGQYKNLARLLEPWDMTKLLPDWAMEEINKAGPRGTIWMDTQTAWLRGILGGWYG